MVSLTAILERIADAIVKNPRKIIIASLIFTFFMAVNAASIRTETDFTKFLPQDLETLQNDKMLTRVFSGNDVVFVVVKIDHEATSVNAITDIRDPIAIQKIDEIEDALRQESQILSVFGLPDLIRQIAGTVPSDIDSIKALPIDDLVSEDKTLTLIVASADVGDDPEKISNVVEIITDNVNSVGVPAGLKVVVTGTPLVQQVLFNLLFSDLYKTIGFTITVIFFALSLSLKSVIRGVLPTVLLLFVIIWTGGTMVLLGIPLSLATVFIGALVVGLGVAYSIYIINRYLEERKKGASPEDAVRTTIVFTGRGVMGSSTTTVMSFIALVGAGTPLMTELGITLSLGIIYAMLSAIFIIPTILSQEELLDRVKRSMVGV